MFYGNKRRYSEREEDTISTSLVTSNIKDTKTSDNEHILNYLSLLSSQKDVSDNSGLMIIKLLKDLGEKVLSRFDGYSADATEDYSDKSIVLIKNKETADSYNTNIKNALAELSKDIEINFVTHSKYEIKQY